MRGIEFLLLLAFPCLTFAGECCEIEVDAPPPECDKWIDPVLKIPIFFQHQFNCSRYWMCNTDLSDCLCECPPMAPEGSLVFDYTIDYENGGPVCNWPWAIECENKPNYCSKCEAWQECIECTDCPDCTEPCDNGFMCVCREGNTCQGDNSLACGTCLNHVCAEPECCSDDDCENSKCIDGKCGECSVDSDCTNMPCSTCESGVCNDPKCCTDEDCASNEYCTDANECVVGCNEDSDCMDGNHPACSVCLDNSCTNPECCADQDCTSMPCSTCESQVCNDPQCCTDEDCASNEYCTDAHECVIGCNEDSDCQDGNHLSCSVCEANSCSDPECCTDIDCPSEKPICDNQVCMAGCKANSDCPAYDGICGGDNSYTEEDSTCFYCNIPDDSFGSCDPGCVNDNNCAAGLICNGQHRCKEPGSFVAVDYIEIDTASCVDCGSSQDEGGAIIYLKGKDGANDFHPECTTNALDHPDKIDYQGISTFSNDNDQGLLGECFLYNLLSEVKRAEITWTGTGEVVLNKVTICWSDENSLCSVCVVQGPVPSGETLPMTCTT